MKSRFIIGDIHGHLDSVKKIIDNMYPDQIILLGDYFDSFTVQPDEQVKCFTELCKMQDSFGKENFIMLIGNHDFHYLNDVNERYSGYNSQNFIVYNTLLEDAIKDNRLQYIYVDEELETIYSHAGVSEIWLSEIGCEIQDINSLGREKFKFTYRDGGNAYGSSKYNSPLWIRPNSLDECAVKGYTQIVGHTHTKGVVIRTSINGDLIYTIDCMPNMFIEEYHHLNTNYRAIRQIRENKNY